MQPVSVTAPAKINLYLHVTGRRDDGYHELDSLVTFCDVADEIIISPAETLSFSCEGQFSDFIDHQDNLCIRAAHYFANTYNINPLCNIHLTKNIPVAAGLGGGSADAAAMLRGLEEVYDVEGGLNMSDVAQNLGADIPVCYKGVSVIMRGIGELCEEMSVPDMYFVLVNPLKTCDTKSVFQNFSAAFRHPCEWGEEEVSAQQIFAETENQLQIPAQQIVPEIEGLIGAMRELEGAVAARQAGSGATCFAVFAGSDDAQNAAKNITNMFPDYWVRVAQKV